MHLCFYVKGLVHIVLSMDNRVEGEAQRSFRLIALSILSKCPTMCMSAQILRTLEVINDVVAYTLVCPFLVGKRGNAGCRLATEQWAKQGIETVTHFSII